MNVLSVFSLSFQASTKKNNLIKTIRQVDNKRRAAINKIAIRIESAKEALQLIHNEEAKEQGSQAENLQDIILDLSVIIERLEEAIELE